MKRKLETISWTLRGYLAFMEIKDVKKVDINLIGNCITSFVIDKEMEVEIDSFVTINGATVILDSIDAYQLDSNVFKVVFSCHPT